MKKINSSFLMYAVLLTTIYACGSAARDQGIQTPERIPVRLLTLQQGEASHIFTASGTFTTNDETVLSFKQGGVLEQIWVEEGDPVKKGQLLARLNPTEVRAAAEQASLAYEKASRDYHRAEGLYRDSVATREQVENAKTAMDITRQQWEAARFNQKYTEIRATMDGYVLQRFVQAGQVLGPGSPVLRINGARQEAWRVEVGVSDRQWASVKVGDSARVYSDLLPQGVASAYVSHRPEGIDPQTGTFVLSLTLNKSSAKSLASGAFARAEIYASRSQKGWRIPYDALLEGDQGKGYVFITRDQSKAEKVQVEVASIQTDYVEISSGLEGIPYLIISGSAYLDEGSPINIVSEPSKTQQK